MPNPNAKTAPERRGPDYHAQHAARAMEALRTLGAGGKRLARSDIKRCEDYSVEVLGDKKYAPWLLVYTVLAGGFKEGWIPDNFYGANVVPAIQGPHGHISFLKSLSEALFDSPAFPNLGSRINGSVFDKAYRPLSLDEARARFFDGNERVVFKPDGTGRGKGIRFFDAHSFDREAVESLGSGVFQRYVSQHPLFDQFSDTSVATVRLTTVVEESGQISLRAGHLRLGSGSDTHILPKSQVSVPFDLATGALRETGLMNWLDCSAHPTTGEPFAGKTVPAFEQCARTVIAHHERVPFVRCIGWDVAVDGNEDVHILEWNGYHNSIILAEAIQGPCFADLGWERLA